MLLIARCAQGVAATVIFLVFGDDDVDGDRLAQQLTVGELKRQGGGVCSLGLGKAGRRGGRALEGDARARDLNPAVSERAVGVRRGARATIEGDARACVDVLRFARVGDGAWAADAAVLLETRERWPSVKR